MKKSREFLKNEELLNEIEIGVKNSIALNESLTRYIDELKALKEINGFYYKLSGIEQMESLNTMLYSQLIELESKQGVLYSTLNRKAKQ